MILKRGENNRIWTLELTALKRVPQSLDHAAWSDLISRDRFSGIHPAV